MRQLFRSAIIAAMMLAPVPTGASERHLTVISHDDAGTKRHAKLSLDQLEALRQVEVVTDNDYLEGPASFSGPLLRDVVGEDELDPDRTIVATALNDYSVEIPAVEVLEHDVILATRKDGRRMSVRDKGPIWIIYPMSDTPELRDARYNNRLVWQLCHVELQ